jgi:hypothetical protein
MINIVLEPRRKDRKEKPSGDACFTIVYDEGCLARICLMETSSVNDAAHRDLFLHRLRRLGTALQDVADSPCSIRRYS